jgi:hypothetical protein
VIEAEEQGFIEKLISHPTVKTLAEPILHCDTGAAAESWSSVLNWMACARQHRSAPELVGP